MLKVKKNKKNTCKLQKQHIKLKPSRIPLMNAYCMQTYAEK